MASTSLSWRESCWRFTRRWLYLVHRWAGIAGCLLIAMWFLSGLVMMYVAFPALSDAERLAGLPPLDLRAVRVSPDAAMAGAGLARFPRSLRLEMMGGRPVYRMIDWDGKPHTVSALDAARIESVDAPAAQEIARRFAGAAAARWVETAERDQWTVPNGLNAWRPLHRIALDDAAGTELYVSARTGEVMRDTNRAERFWNWLGAVPHWLYFTPVRADPPLWRQVVLWTSGVCIAVAVSGIWIGWLRLRVRRRFAHGSAGGTSPYRGWMAWHHIAGLAGSLFLLAWLASGWLSVNPNQWFPGRAFTQPALERYAGQVLPHFPPGDRRALAQAAGPREIRMAWQAGLPVWLVATADAGTVTTRAYRADTGRPLALSAETLTEAAARLVPGARIAGSEWLTQHDAYWYGHHQPRKLPVLRVRFDDAARTWAYIDPANGNLLGRSDSSRRVYRWLFNASHSWDFGWLLRYRPAWDIVVCLLSIAGLVVSVSGVVIGWRRLFRGRRRA
ncbi:PepSY-associated TM helix domain-containing protein [Cupriavidus basilensis]|uniref:PepSY-associated TM helix domain-containing protein n=1 Tax=Cupriavidus basilensis TaxID=68895 RepID=A0ABT6AUU6_9BURK|nr:PepSY-associated TM helix domain-containing protein [Cupriavidus basilensis]MDF3836393.1 PepSY-associated TM helix domain-containing protein [Cupriavidus basilensis]